MTTQGCASPQQVPVRFVSVKAERPLLYIYHVIPSRGDAMTAGSRVGQLCVWGGVSCVAPVGGSLWRGGGLVVVVGWSTTATCT